MEVRLKFFANLVTAFLPVALSGCADPEPRLSHDFARRSDFEFKTALDYMRKHDPEVLRTYGEANLNATYIEGREWRCVAFYVDMPKGVEGPFDGTLPTYCFAKFGKEDRVMSL
jgi:hypothetical protein